MAIRIAMLTFYGTTSSSLILAAPVALGQPEGWTAPSIQGLGFWILAFLGLGLGKRFELCSALEFEKFGTPVGI